MLDVGDSANTPKVLDMIVVDQAVWVAIAFDREIGILGRRYKPHDAHEEMLLLRLDLASGRILAESRRQDITSVSRASFAASDGVTYLLAVMTRPRTKDDRGRGAPLSIEIERLDPNGLPQWSRYAREVSPGTLEFAATRGVVYIVGASRQDVTMGTRTAVAPPGPMNREHYWRATITPSGEVQELEFPPIGDDVTQLSFTTDGVTEIFVVTGALPRVIARGADGKWMEWTITSDGLCGGARVWKLPHAFLVTMFSLVLVKREDRLLLPKDTFSRHWELVLLSPLGRPIAHRRIDADMPGNLFDSVQWSGATAVTWGNDAWGEDPNTIYHHEILLDDL